MADSMGFLRFEGTHVVRETDKALLVSIQTVEYWLPRGPVRHGFGYVEMPFWLAERKGLIGPESPDHRNMERDLESELLAVVKKYGLCNTMEALGKIAGRAKRARR